MATMARTFLWVTALVCGSHAQFGRSPLLLPPFLPPPLLPPLLLPPLFPFGLKPPIPFLTKPPLPLPIPIPVPAPFPLPLPVKPIIVGNVRYAPVGFQDPTQFTQGQFMSDMGGGNTFNMPVQPQMADVQQFRSQQPGSQQMATRLQVTVPVAGGGGGSSQSSFQQISRSQGVSDNDAQISLRGPTQILLPANIRILPVSADQFSSVSAQGQPQQTARAASSYSAVMFPAAQQFQPQVPASRAADCRSGATLEDVQIANSPCTPVMGVPPPSEEQRQVAFAGSVPNAPIYATATGVQGQPQQVDTRSQFESQPVMQPQGARASADCRSGATLEDVQIANSPCTPVLGVPPPVDAARQAGFAGSVSNVPVSPDMQVSSQDASAQAGFSSDSQDMVQSGVASGERTLQVRLRIPLPDDNAVQDTQIPVEAERSNVADSDLPNYSAVLKSR